MNAQHNTSTQIHSPIHSLHSWLKIGPALFEKLRDVQIKLSDEEIEVVCTIVATAEYCSEIVGALGRSMTKTLDPPFNEQVSSRLHIELCSFVGSQVLRSEFMPTFCPLTDAEVQLRPTRKFSWHGDFEQTSCKSGNLCLSLGQ